MGASTERAFPGSSAFSSEGMSLRDWFAGQAVVWLLADGKLDGPAEIFARQAYRMADAMLEARQEAK